MKKAPYQNIINLKEERKEYSLLCSGKSKNFRVYSEWENHILECIKKFDLEIDLYNFKRFCINASRAQEKAPEMYLAFIGMFIPLYLGSLWEEMPFYITPIVWCGLFAYIIIQNKKLAKESYFFKDLVEIIEKFEEQKKK